MNTMNRRIFFWNQTSNNLLIINTFYVLFVYELFIHPLPGLRENHVTEWEFGGLCISESPCCKKEDFYLGNEDPSNFNWNTKLLKKELQSNSIVKTKSRGGIKFETSLNTIPISKLHLEIINIILGCRQNRCVWIRQTISEAVFWKKLRVFPCVVDCYFVPSSFPNTRFVFISCIISSWHILTFCNACKINITFVISRNICPFKKRKS